MSRFWSAAVRQTKPYTPGEQCNDPAWVKLNTNESPFGPSDKVLAAIRDETSNRLRLYPDPEATALREAIARYHRVSADQVFTGNGSDEVLAHAFAALLKHQEPVLMPDVTYSFYASCCALYGIARVEMPLSEAFEIEVSAYERANGGIVFPNPNAPTGRWLALESIEELLRRHPTSVVLVDEAYVDFGGTSAVPLVAKYPNLLVVQTLSKSRGLAGLRVGFAIGHEDLIEALERIKNSVNSYPLGRLALAGAVAAMDDVRHLDEVRAATIANRSSLAQGLVALGFEVVPSMANFSWFVIRATTALGCSTNCESGESWSATLRRTGSPSTFASQWAPRRSAMPC